MIENTRERNKNWPRKPPVPPAKKKDLLLNEIFFDKYKTIKKLGEGSFGKVYKAEYNGEYYALKFENKSNRTRSLLEMESTVMAYLQGPNIPYIKSFGYSGDYNLLVMQLLDKSLEDIFRIRKTFSIKTTAMIGFQLIGVLHFIHDKNFIHRDVKPDNCVMGSAELNENLYLIDFGLAKKYRSSRTLKQYPLTKRKKLTGTARYASINALEGLEQSRRDDMESVGYVMAYLLRGGLPWQGMKLKTKENKYKNILEKKKEISSTELFKGFPSEFSEILDNIKKLEYTEEPEYEMLRNKLLSLCKRLNYNFDYVYDWTTEKDLLKRKEKKSLTSIKTNSTLSLKKSTKRSKSKKKIKFIEKSIEELRRKSKKNKKEKNKGNTETKEDNEDIKEENEDNKNEEIKEENDENKNDEIKEEVNEEEKKEEIKITNEQNEENHENNESDIAKEENIDKSIEKNEADNISKDNHLNDNKNNIINHNDNVNDNEVNIIEKNNSNENENVDNNSKKDNESQNSQNENKCNVVNEDLIINTIETKEDNKLQNESIKNDKNEEEQNIKENGENSEQIKSNNAEISEEEREDTEKTICCTM